MQEEPSFPLVDVPDIEVSAFLLLTTLEYGVNSWFQLDEEGLKEKKKQRLMKAGYEARLRAREEKERDRKEREAEERREEEERECDLGAWANKLKKEQEVILPTDKDNRC